MALQLFKIASTTVESPVSEITFSSIPSGYTDLILKLSGRTSVADISGGYRMRFNGASADTNLSSRYLQGSGAAASSASLSYLYLGDLVGTTATSNTFGSMEIYIPNYAGSNNKSVSIDSVTENNATTAYTHFVAGLWSDTSAITSISILRASATALSNTTATLYGVL